VDKNGEEKKGGRFDLQYQGGIKQGGKGVPLDGKLEAGAMLS